MIYDGVPSPPPALLRRARSLPLPPALLPRPSASSSSSSASSRSFLYSRPRAGFRGCISTKSRTHLQVFVLLARMTARGERSPGGGKPRRRKSRGEATRRGSSVPTTIAASNRSYSRSLAFLVAKLQRRSRSPVPRLLELRFAEARRLTARTRLDN